MQCVEVCAMDIDTKMDFASIYFSLYLLLGTNSTHALLKGVQENNKALAMALQSEKEKGRQANAVILQLKKEQQALFLHLLLLKKKLKEQEALVAKASKVQ